MLFLVFYAYSNILMHQIKEKTDRLVDYKDIG